MAKCKYTDRVCLIITLLMLVITLLFCFGERFGLTAVDRSSLGTGAHYEAGIRFSGTDVEIKGSGVYHAEGVVTIGYAGSYTLGGTLTEGQIIVDAGSEAAVTLIFDGVDVTCSDSAALWVRNAGSVTVRTVKGTENTLRCGETFSAEAEAAEVSATLYSEDNLVLEGEGTLRVEGACRHGIVGKDDVTIRSGSVLVNAVEDGVRGRDKLVIEDGTITVTAGCDALRSNNDTDESKGSIRICGGALSLRSGNDAIHAEHTLTIRDAALTVLSGGGAAAFAGKDPDAPQTVSAKGLKAAVITIEDGTLALDCMDDAIHANDSITVSGGTLTISTGDDAVHADDSLLIADGVITITGCQEGLEANLITVSGGSIDIVSRNDGINASSGTNWVKLYGAGQGEAVEELAVFRQCGGAIRIRAQDDGVDSNGDIRIEGGSLLISAEAGGHNKALDCGKENGGVCLVTGGTVIACGYYDTAENFDDGSTQCSALFHTAELTRAGSEFVLTDENGSRLMSFVPEYEYNAVLFSAAAMQSGKRFTVTVAGRPTVISLSGLCGVYAEKRSADDDD